MTLARSQRGKAWPSGEIDNPSVGDFEDVPLVVELRDGGPGVDGQAVTTQTHGTALTPDEHEIWIVDAFYRHLHVFDVTPLPDAAPRQIADIPLVGLPKWINFTRDARSAHVSTGEIVDARTRRVTALVEKSRHFVQIDWEDGRTVRAYSRYGLGYAEPDR